MQRAWVERDLLRLRYLEQHPDFVAQQARVAAMESQLRSAPAGPEVLLETAGELAALGTHLAEKHPKHQDQTRKVAALRRHLLAPGPERAELRLARAMQEYYGGALRRESPEDAGERGAARGAGAEGEIKRPWRRGHQPRAAGVSLPATRGTDGPAAKS